MLALVERLAGHGGATREVVRRETARPNVRAKAFIFAFRPPTKAFDLRLAFRKTKVEPDEIIEALENIIRELKNQSRPQA
jgi:hypothetical protein